MSSGLFCLFSCAGVFARHKAVSADSRIAPFFQPAHSLEYGAVISVQCMTWLAVTRSLHVLSRAAKRRRRAEALKQPLISHQI